MQWLKFLELSILKSKLFGCGRTDQENCKPLTAPTHVVK